MNTLQNLTTLSQTTFSGKKIELKQLSNVRMSFNINITTNLIDIELPYLVDEIEWEEKSLKDKWEEIKKYFGTNFIGIYSDQSSSGIIQVSFLKGPEKFSGVLIKITNQSKIEIIKWGTSSENQGSVNNLQISAQTNVIQQKYSYIESSSNNGI